MKQPKWNKNDPEKGTRCETNCKLYCLREQGFQSSRLSCKTKEEKEYKAILRNSFRCILQTVQL